MTADTSLPGLARSNDRLRVALATTADALSADGTDSTRNVDVRVRAGRVVEVVVHDVWRSALRPSQLGAAVLEAAGVASGRALDPVTAPGPRSTTSAGGLAGAADVVEPLRLPPVSPSAPAEASMSAFLDVLAELNSGLRATLERIDADDRLGSEPGAATTRRSEHVTLTFVAGALTDVQVDVEWASRTDGVAVTREFARALASDDHGVAPDPLQADGHGLGRLARVAALADDPAQLAARLRLTD